MATQWLEAHLGSPRGLLFISSFRLCNRVRRYSQGPQANPVLRLLFFFLSLNQQNKPSYVRFYRDYSIADFAFCAFTLILFTYATFLGPARAGVCEEFSHHPELMRYMQEMGLNLENCERWLERAVSAVLVVLFVIMIIRVSYHPIIIQW